MDEDKYQKQYNFQIKEGWDGEGYLLLSQDRKFNSFQTHRFTQGLMLGDIAILFNQKFELDEETIDIIKLLNLRKEGEKAKND